MDPVDEAEVDKTFPQSTSALQVHSIVKAVFSNQIPHVGRKLACLADAHNERERAARFVDLAIMTQNNYPTTPAAIVSARDLLDRHISEKISLRQLAARRGGIHAVG